MRYEELKRLERETANEEPNINWHNQFNLEKDNVKCVDVTKHDPVNNPLHYNRKGIECINAIEASMGEEEFKGYLKGNAIKYLWRYRYKNNAVQDLEKCIWYTTKLKEVEDGVEK